MNEHEEGERTECEWNEIHAMTVKLMHCNGTRCPDTSSVESVNSPVSCNELLSQPDPPCQRYFVFHFVCSLENHHVMINILTRVLLFPVAVVS